MTIDWKPLAEIPDALKDGRQVLLWEPKYGADVGTWQTGNHWSQQEDDAGYWEALYECALIEGKTHYAEITPPGEE